jgi:hypothetical protein
MELGQEQQMMQVQLMNASVIASINQTTGKSVLGGLEQQTDKYFPFTLKVSSFSSFLPAYYSTNSKTRIIRSWQSTSTTP